MAPFLCGHVGACGLWPATGLTLERFYHRLSIHSRMNTQPRRERWTAFSEKEIDHSRRKPTSDPCHGGQVRHPRRLRPVASGDAAAHAVISGIVAGLVF